MALWCGDMPLICGVSLGAAGVLGSCGSPTSFQDRCEEEARAGGAPTGPRGRSAGGGTGRGRRAGCRGAPWGGGTWADTVGWSATPMRTWVGGDRSRDVGDDGMGGGARQGTPGEVTQHDVQLLPPTALDRQRAPPWIRGTAPPPSQSPNQLKRAAKNHGAGKYETDILLLGCTRAKKWYLLRGGGGYALPCDFMGAKKTNTALVVWWSGCPKNTD